MRIAYFTDTFAPEKNGVANTLAMLSGYLEQKGIQHVFFAPDYPYRSKEHTKIDMLPKTKHVYRFKGIQVGISPNSSLAFPNPRIINSLCDTFNPDIVHVTNEFGIGNRGMKYAVSRNLPLIMSYHTDYCKYLDYFSLSHLEPFAEKYLKWFYHYSDKTLVPSQHTLKQLEMRGYDNLGIWSRGIDTDRFSDSLRSTEFRRCYGIDNKFVFLYVGRLSPEKGLHVLLNAIERINRLFPGKAAFVFTGDGPYADKIRQSGFDNVVMTGFKTGKELSEVYASCDCFAFPSATETFGNTPLEALASGLPVVGINAGGVTEFLIHGYNSLLVDNGDQEAFTEAMIAVMQQNLLRFTLAQNSLETARARDWNSIFDGLLFEYRAAMEKRMAISLANVS